MVEFNHDDHTSDESAVFNHKGHTLAVESAETPQGVPYYKVTDRNNGDEYSVAPTQGFQALNGRMVPDQVKEGVKKFHDDQSEFY